MEHAQNILVVGGGELRQDLARIVPPQQLTSVDHPLDALWAAGEAEYYAAIVGMRANQRTLRVIDSLRKLRPKLRIVVGCTPAEEPLARRALATGADEYVLLPLVREDVLSALHVAPRAGPDPVVERIPEAALAPERDVARLTEIIATLHAGATATLHGFAELLQQAFAAQGVEIEYYEDSATIGQTEPVVLSADIKHDANTVGAVRLGPPRLDAYADDAPARLATFAQLIGVTVAQARERAIWQDLAWTDDLSGLRNRRYFEQALEELLARAAEHRGRLTLLLFDIDDFKSYNDRFGHETGDRLIQEIAALLKRCTREQDIVSRLGGDEFAVILWDAEQPRVPGSSHPDDPMQVAQRFCREIATHDFECLGAEAPGPVTISGGLACFPWHGNAGAELLVAADQALLDAKRTGKNRIQLAGEKPTR